MNIIQNRSSLELKVQNVPATTVSNDHKPTKNDTRWGWM